MREAQSMVAGDLSLVLEKLHRQFGVWRLARALAVVAWRSRQPAGAEVPMSGNRIEDLSDRMRQDIGLHHQPDGPVRRGAQSWERWR